jgi:drug/metabolite transporter (DMT)-like permease
LCHYFLDMNSTTNKAPVLAYLALAAVCIVWGTTYLALRIGVTQFPPFLFSLLRFLSAGPILLFLVLVVGKQKWPDRKTLLNQAVCGFFMVTLGICMVGWAEVYISSGVAAIICSMMPVWTVLINVIVTKDEKPNWLIIVGLAMGLSGVLLIFGEHLSEFSNTNYQVGIATTFAANLCWAIGSIWIKKKNQNTNPFMGAGLQMTFGGIAIIPLSLLFDDYSTIKWSSDVVYSLIYMILIGSVAAYACYSYAIKKLPMTLVSLYAYINPIVAVILGWLVLNEKLNLRISIAILVTIAGIYIVNKGYKMKTSQEPNGIKSFVKNLKLFTPR